MELGITKLKSHARTHNLLFERCGYQKGGILLDNSNPIQSCENLDSNVSFPLSSSAQ